MKFYCYNQNNSGGSFVFDREQGLTHYVIVEAPSAEAANQRAESIGLYFDDESDCPCCGSRWSEAWSDADGDEVPSVYGEPVGTFTGYCWMEPGAEIVVHYADGRRAWHGDAVAPTASSAG